MIRRAAVVAVASLSVSLFAACVAAAAPGDVDLSYGAGTGGSRIDLGQSETAKAVALQPDGKIIVAGTTTSPGTGDVVVARLNNPQGTLDSSFGAFNGISRIDLGQTENASTLALQPDGKMIVAGTRTAGGGSSSQAFVARLTNPAGLLDTTYAQGAGWSQINFPGFVQASANAVALQPDGKIVIAGDTYNSAALKDVLVARLNNPDGTFDSSYGLGTGGSRVDLGQSESASAIALQPDGKILVAGTKETTPPDGGTSDDFLVVRLLNPQGTLDDGFKGAGLAIGAGYTTVGFGAHSVARAMVLQPDGKILVAGYTDATGTDDFAIARLQSSGALDETFGSGGKTTLDFGGSDQASAMVLQPDGKILLVGTTQRGPAVEIAAARLQPNGAPDRTFGTDGKTIINAGGADEFANAVALQPDGKIIIAGTTTGNGYDMFVVRLQGGPPGDSGGRGGGAGGAGSGGGGSGPGVTRLSGLGVSPQTVSVAGRLVNRQCVRPTAHNKHAARCRRAITLRISYKLTTAARVAFTLTRRDAGRSVSRHCVKPAKSNHNRRRCTRLTRVPGQITHNAQAGWNTLTFTGTIGGHHLGPGSYQLTVVPGHGASQTVTFRIMG